MMTTNKTIEKKRGNLPSKKPLGLYLHIPFCVQKCNYCDFLSFGGSGAEEQITYIKALKREIKYYGILYRNIYYVDSIFIGGGTPSLIESSLIAELIEEIKENFLIYENIEFSIESNPKTLTKEKMKMYIDSGINRLSIGAQSLDNEILKYMGRVHITEDIISNYNLARECGFQNINLDLMFAVPGQSTNQWMETLNRAMELEPEHISFYSLQIEEGTPFFSMFQAGNLKEVDDETDRDMYHRTLSELKNRGYFHYEISNAAKAGYQCRHNLKYWSMEDYLGLGLGAHSFISGTRFSNAITLADYSEPAFEKFISESQQQENNKNSPFTVWNHENTRREMIAEYIFTGMRKSDGIDLKDFERRFKQPIEDIYFENWHKLQKFIEGGYLIKTAENMRFSAIGIDISNRILSEFV